MGYHVIWLKSSQGTDMASKLRLIASTVLILIITYFCMFASLFQTGQSKDSTIETTPGIRHETNPINAINILQRTYRSIRDNQEISNETEQERSSKEIDEGISKSSKNTVVKHKKMIKHEKKTKSDGQSNQTFVKKREAPEPEKAIITLQETGNHTNVTNSNEDLSIIYVITPTYKRLNQIPELTRLSNTLANVKALHWIVVEEGEKLIPEVNHLLSTSGIHFTYLNAKPYTNVSRSLKGIHQRNKAIFWLRKNVDMSKTGVVYFADDDNTYTLKLFDEMRFTKKVSVWPVGFVSGRKYQTPIVRNGQIVKFDAWNADQRKFAVDMAGFALNTKLFYYNPHLYFWKTFKIGLQETMFLEICCRLKDLEPKADNCTEVLVWHTKARDPIIKHNSYNDTDPSPIIRKNVKTKHEEVKTKRQSL